MSLKLKTSGEEKDGVKRTRKEIYKQGERCRANFKLTKLTSGLLKENFDGSDIMLLYPNAYDLEINARSVDCY